jgi:endonuclease YncB( thermonuclease family)
VLVLAIVASAVPAHIYRIDHVSDGDTLVLRNGQRVRLVQIDTPEPSLCRLVRCW